MAKYPFLKLVFFLFFFASCEVKNPDKRNSSFNTSKQLTLIYLNKLQLDSIVNANFKDTFSGQSLGNPQLLNKGQSGEEYYLIKRNVAGYVEIHESWDDVVIIRSGHGILRTGKEVIGETEQSDKKPFRNWHGGTIVNASEQKLEAGDFLIIPAMTAHQYIPNNNDSLTYWTIKIRRQNK